MFSFIVPFLLMSIYLHTYNSLQILISSIGGYELPTKCITMVLVNDFNDDGNLSRSFIALSGFSTKLVIFPLSACCHVILPLLVYINLTNMVQQ
jgi:hypothetical protein